MNPIDFESVKISAHHHRNSDSQQSSTSSSEIANQILRRPSLSSSRKSLNLSRQSSPSDSITIQAAVPQVSESLRLAFAASDPTLSLLGVDNQIKELLSLTSEKTASGIYKRKELFTLYLSKNGQIKWKEIPSNFLTSLFDSLSPIEETHKCLNVILKRLNEIIKKDPEQGSHAEKVFAKLIENQFCIEILHKDPKLNLEFFHLIDKCVMENFEENARSFEMLLRIFEENKTVLINFLANHQNQVITDLKATKKLDIVLSGIEPELIESMIDHLSKGTHPPVSNPEEEKKRVRICAAIVRMLRHDTLIGLGMPHEVIGHLIIAFKNPNQVLFATPRVCGRTEEELLSVGKRTYAAVMYKHNELSAAETNPLSTPMSSYIENLKPLEKGTMFKMDQKAEKIKVLKENALKAYKELRFGDCVTLLRGEYNTGFTNSKDEINEAMKDFSKRLIKQMLVVGLIEEDAAITLLEKNKDTVKLRFYIHLIPMLAEKISLLMIGEKIEGNGEHK